MLKILLPLAQKYGHLPVRTRVADSLLLSLRHDKRHLLSKIGWKFFYSLLSLLAAAKARRAGLPTADKTVGLMQSGHLTEEYLVDVIEHATRSNRWQRVRVIEIYCHPSLVLESPRFGPNPGDLVAVTGPKLREVLAARQVGLANYRQLQEQGWLT